MTYVLEIVDEKGELISEAGVIKSDHPLPIPAPGDILDIQIKGLFRAIRRTFVYEHADDGSYLCRVRVHCEWPAV